MKRQHHTGWDIAVAVAAAMTVYFIFLGIIVMSIGMPLMLLAFIIKWVFL